MTEKMSVTEKQLKVVFQMGAISESINLVEISFSQKGNDLFVHEKFRKTDTSVPYFGLNQDLDFWLRTTLISPFGVRTHDIEEVGKE